RLARRIVVRLGLGAVVPPAGVPQALEQGRRVPVEEMHVAAGDLVEQRQDAPAPVPRGDRLPNSPEVLRQLEDHTCASTWPREWQVGEQRSDGGRLAAHLLPFRMVCRRTQT